ncbi:SMC family ATPase [Candidatus Woesearchaeota archaeon]|nr:SMC family ATPase [Candidatus Woesearchaeota archaeon]
MLVKYVKLLNIRSYLSEQISFPPGTLLLSGDIGSGKSTVLLAIEFALFGVVRGGVDGASLLRYGKNFGYVEVCFDFDGSQVIVHRELKRSKESVSQAAGFIIVDGIKTDCTPVELKARILDFLGYPKSLLTKSKALIYRYTVYTPQEEMKHILFEDAAARLDTLRRVFQIDKYKLIRDNAAVVSASLRERVAELTAKTEDLAAKKAQLSDFNAKLKAAAGSLGMLIPLLKDNQQKIAAQQQLVQKYEADLQKLNSLRAAVQAHNAAIAEKQNSIAASKQEIANASKQVDELKSSASDSDSILSEFSSNLGYLNRHVSLLQSEVAEKNAVSERIDALHNSLNVLSAGITKAETTKLSSKELESNVLTSETCPVCLQQISEQHKSHFRKKISAELRAAEKVIAAKTSEKDDLNKQLLSAKEKFRALIEKERRLAELSALCRGFSRQAEELSVSAQQRDGMYEIVSVLESLNSASQALRSKSQIMAAMEDKNSYISMLNGRIRLTAGSIDSLYQQIDAAKSEMRRYLPSEQDFGTIKSRLNSLQQNEKELLVRKASFDRDIENITSNIDLLRAEISGKEQDYAALHSCLQLKNWLADHFLNLMDVIERNVMLKVYNEFNSLFQTWFNILIEDESISARLDDAFSPIVEINGYEMPLENLSGGEKTSCALAYRLALNKVVNDVISSIKTKDILILDEPTDGFSSEQLEKVRDVLDQLQLPQIIVVSHESKIESFVEHLIRVVKQQHVSRIV